MKIDEANEVFSARTFWLQVAPLIAGEAVMIGIAVWLPMKDTIDARGWTMLLGFVFVIIPLSEGLRYRWAARRHYQLQAQHGEAYVKLIEEGKIVISPWSVLSAVAPGRPAKTFFPEPPPGSRPPS